MFSSLKTDNSSQFLSQKKKKTIYSELYALQRYIARFRKKKLIIIIYIVQNFDTFFDKNYLIFFKY